MTSTKWMTALVGDVAQQVMTPATLLPVSLAAVAYLTARKPSPPEPESDKDTRPDRRNGATPIPESTVPSIQAAAADAREGVAADLTPPLVHTPHLVHTADHARGARLGKFSAHARAKVNDPRPHHHRGRVFEEADVARHNTLHPRDRWSLTETNAKAVDATVDRTDQPIQHKARYGYFNEKASDATKLSTNRALHRKALRDIAKTTGRYDGILRATRGGGTGLRNVEESRISEENLIECINNEWRAANFGRVCGHRAIEGALVAAAMAAARGPMRMLEGETTLAEEAGNVVEAGVAGAVATGVTAVLSWVGGTLFLNATLVAIGAPLAGLAAVSLFEKTGLGKPVNRLVRKMVEGAQRVSVRLANRLGVPVVDAATQLGVSVRDRARNGYVFARRVQQRLQSWWRRWLGPPEVAAV